MSGLQDRKSRHAFPLPRAASGTSALAVASECKKESPDFVRHHGRLAGKGEMLVQLLEGRDLEFPPRLYPPIRNYGKHNTIG